MRSSTWFIGLLLLIAPAFVASAPAHAQSTGAPQTAEARQQEVTAAIQAGVKAGTRGPVTVPLLDQASLRLPTGMIFVPPAEASRMLRAFGNRVLSDPVGLVIGTGRSDDWFVVIRFVKDGYIKDDDAKDWKADALLASLREGTDEANKDRVSRGFPELEIIGWIAPPAYDPGPHRLVWSLAQKIKGEPTPAVQGVNYNTYALGREGYFNLGLVTSSDRIANDRQVVAALLAGLTYDSGKAYEDFNASTDHIAAYGLAALVGVVAAKKLGLLALGAAFLAKFAKVGILLAVGAGAAVMRVLRRRRPGGTA